jgi:VWFA-related protein
LAEVVVIFACVVGVSAQNTTKPTADQRSTTLQTSAESTVSVPADVSVRVNVVNVFASVRDKHHNVVNNLTKDDFALTSDSVPQTIRYFSQESNLPLTLGLLVDTSLSQREVLDDERSASYKFLDQMLHEKDLAFVIHFDHEVELLQDVTSSRSKLENVLQSLRIAQPAAESDNNAPQNPESGRGHRHMRRGGTLLYDAVYLASEELMKKRTGRKAIIVLTDGVDRGSKESLASAIEAAQRADCIVYAIYFKSNEEGGFNHGGYGRPHIGMGGGGYPGGGRYPGGGQGRYPQESHVDGKKVLQQVSQQTGGRMFEVSKKNSVGQIYSEISDELRNQYSLGFTPTPQAASTGYHKIQLTTKKKDMAVQARDGYYSAE